MKVLTEGKMLAVLIVVGAVFLGAGTAFLLLYNRLVRLRNRADNAWHQVDVQLSRRHSLIPGLRVVVEGYASHERQALEAAAAARSHAMDARGARLKYPAEEGLSGAVGGLFALAERYPDLKADGEFKKLQQELSNTENEIAGARKYYNGTVMYYDNARQGFPGNIVARLFPRSFTDREYFEA